MSDVAENIQQPVVVQLVDDFLIHQQVETLPCIVPPGHACRHMQLSCTDYFVRHK